MKTIPIAGLSRLLLWLTLAALAIPAAPLGAQTLINVNFGVGSSSRKTGLAATGQTTNDYWNLYRHYDPKYTPGMPLVADGILNDLKYADGGASPVSLAVNNAPGVWGNSTGDAMYDAYIFSQNDSNIVVTLRHLEAGRYHFYLYGHADADVTGEQNSVFTLRTGTNTFGPLAASGGPGWKATSPWLERQQYVVFRDVTVAAGQPVIIEVAPGANGVAVLNGLQIISRGTSPPQIAPTVLAQGPPANTNLLFREIQYTGQVTDTEARFETAIEVESMSTNEISAPLFEGDLAVLPAQVPEGLRIVGSGKQFLLFAAKPGHYELKLDVVAKITRAEPWNQISFTGPAAAIASVSASASGAGMELQLLSGTQLESSPGGTNVPAANLRGFLGADGLLAMRWQNKAAEVARKSLVTVDTTAAAQITPTVIKFTTQFHYEILQAGVANLAIAFPATQALTKLDGEQIRNWQIKADGERQILTVEFIKPVEKSCSLTLLTEQAVDAASPAAQLVPPQPLAVERESGSFTLAADEMTVDIGATEGLRQVNARDGALAAYRFYGRPFALTAKLKRIEPVVSVADRVAARVEDTRLLIGHTLTLTVEKAGIYAVDMTPTLPVTDVRGDDVEDWKVSDGHLHVNFNSRLLGVRQLEVSLEQPYKEVPAQLAVVPLPVIGAARETAEIGAASAPGIRLKTAELTGLREIPVATLALRRDESLAYRADQSDWKLTLAGERLPARIVADVFNLVTIGDGLVGGSATIRYGIVNQGVQDFKVKLPAHWKNVEFTGPNIRRKDHQGDLWTVTLQDKAWNGYTLVITYDYQFDPRHAALDAAGAHTLETERETGSVAITTAGSLKLEPQPVAEPLRVIDPTELADSDRALITRPVLLAYQYTGNSYHLQLDVTRHDQVPVLDAVADHTQLTTVLTDAGEMLTEASFMVKNNDKQFQKFKLPADATLWGCYVNGEPVKAEQDGAWLLVSLPQEADRDQAFAVDIKYAEQIAALKSSLPQTLKLEAPATDVPNTYAEWELFAPTDQRLSSFGGNMTVARGTTYGLRDAWQGFTDFYAAVWEQIGLALFFVGGMVVLLIILIWQAAKHGSRGLIEALAVIAILGILAGMLLPALARSKSKAIRINAVNDLKQIALGARLFAGDNNNRFPSNYEEMMNELGTDKVLIDPESGQRFLYVGAGKHPDDPNAIVAYSPTDQNGRAVAFADGSVQQLSSSRFEEALQRETAAYAGHLSGNGAATIQTPAAEASTFAFSGGRGMMPRSEEPAQAEIAGQMAAPATPPPSLGVLEAPTATGPTISGVPAVAGIRSIRIDIPRIGHAFNFTKVLNVGSEPLAIQMSVLPARIFALARMVLQLTVFLTGLLILWFQRLRAERNSFWTAVGAALAIVSAGSLFIAFRALHFVFISVAPVLVLWLLIQILKKYIPRKAAPPVISVGDLPPVTLALLLVCLVLGRQTCLAGEADQLPPKSAAITNTVSIVSASYVGRVGERVAQFDATLQLSAFGTNQTVPLFGADLALEQFSVKSGAARLLRAGNSVSVLLDQPGEVVLEVKLVAKLGGDVTRRQLDFSLPPALASRLEVTIAEPDADVEFPTAVSFQRTSGDQETRVEAIVGSSGRVEMQWTPRVKRADEIAATVFCQNTTLVTFGGGVVNTLATLNYQVTQGELRQARVRLPAGQRLLRVEGDSIRTWELKQEEGEVLVVDLLKGESPGCRLVVETEKVLDKLPVRADVAAPHALDVKRETGMVAVRSAEEVSVTLADAPELQRMDIAEFTGASGESANGIIAAYRFLKPDFQLVARVEDVQPQLEAVVRNQTRIDSDQVRLAAEVDYSIKRAGVFDLELSLPAGYALQSVAGEDILQWTEQTEAGARILKVSLKERKLGLYALRIELTRPLKELPPTVEAAGVYPLGAQKLTGFVSVSAEPGVAVKTAAFEGLTEIPATDLPGGTDNGLTGVLAYKFMAADAQSTAQWKLSVATETVEPWVRAEVVNLVTVADTLASGRAVVRYDIQNAPVKEFRLKVPAAWKNVEILGANIRRRDQNGAEWRVELQNKISGPFWLTVTWEQPGNFNTNDLEVSGVQALDVERETGSLAILAKAPLQVGEKQASEELVRIDARELPDWAGVGGADTRADGEVPVLAYRYVRPGYKLTLAVKRFEDAAVLQALVDSMQLTTVVADDGQVMTEMKLGIHNNGRQDLAVELPAGAQVWSAFVAGRPVRPSRQEGRLLLPLERSGADGQPVAVELTYIGKEMFPQRQGNVDLVSPKLDMPLKNARWELYLPPDYDYENFSGSMTHEAEAAPVYQVYSLSEYSRQEEDKKVERQAAVQSFLSLAHDRLASGQVRELTEAYSRARDSRFDDDKESKDLAQVEEGLRQAQSSNLINAQRAYTADNQQKLGTDTAGIGGGGGQGGESLNYDAAAAEQQWTKLQQAQELGVTKVPPLRVNLPTRGLRHAFTQVLQTEVNKPMTIHFAAASTRSMSWPSRIALAVGSFLGLWLLVAILPHRRNHTIPTPQPA